MQDKWSKSPSATKTEINNNQPFLKNWLIHEMILLWQSKSTQSLFITHKTDTKPLLHKLGDRYQVLRKKYSNKTLPINY